MVPLTTCYGADRC